MGASFWTGRRVLVTGAGGFIASHLTERLVCEQAQVRAFVRYTSRGDVGHLKYLSKGVFDQLEVVAGDLRDADAVSTAARGIDVILHLGALIAIPYSYLHPREVVDTNVLGSLNVLMAARTHEVPKLVHISTSEVYGTAQYVPIDERHPFQGQSPYSASKIGADRLAESFYRSYELPVAIVRPFNTFGPRQSARAVIPTIITQALTHDEVILGDLESTRDFTYVTDTVDGMMKAAQSPLSVGEEMNLGSNSEISIGSLARKIATLIGREVRFTRDPQRIRPSKSEVQRLWANNEKAKRIIGWSPQVPLDEGLSRTVQWINDHLDNYRIGHYQI